MATNRTIQELLDLMEIPENGRDASPTSQFGVPRKKGSDPHGGFDMNRGHAVGGSVSSPVYGIIGRERGGNFGKIVIHEVDPVTKELTGFDIEVLHTQAQSVGPGDKVEPRKKIGTEGGVGAGGVSHAHFQVFKGSDPTPLNPLRHLYEYHHPGQPIPPLPQFEPRFVPPIHPPRRDPAEDPIFQTPGRSSVEEGTALGDHAASSSAPKTAAPGSPPQPPEGNARLRLTPQPNRSASSPRSPGPPMDIKTPAQTGPEGPVGPALAPAPTMPPMYFAPDASRRFGPFVVPPGPMSGSGVGIDATSSPQLRSPQPSIRPVPSLPSPIADETVNPNVAAPGPSGNKPIRYLSGRVASPPQASPFDTVAPAVPFVVANNPLVPAPPASFNDRYPTPLPIGPQDPDQPEPQFLSGSATQRDPKDIRVLSSRFPMLNPGGVGVALGSPSPQSPPNASPPQAGRPPATRPLPDYPVPPSVYGLPDRDAHNMDDWFTHWIKPLFDER